MRDSPARPLLFLLLLASGCGGTTSQTANDAAAPADLSRPLTGCHSGTLDGNETDVDCGGSCAPCDDGKSCKVDRDCVNAFCDRLNCATPSCTDGVKDGLESDVDCGGTTCPKCALGKLCDAPLDCDSGSCMGGKCVPDKCKDGMKDGLETDVDCGGVLCPGCAGGQHCMRDDDCASRMCLMGGLCAAAPTCTDGIKNGAETDVDCGGMICPKCDEYKACLIVSDCKSFVCENKVCVAAPIKVLVAGADSANNLSDVAFRLKALSGIASVDTTDASSVTPALATLKNYDAVLVFAAKPFASAATLGDNLADFYDAGGRVVLAGGAVAGANAVAGRFGLPANGYLLIDPAGGVQMAMNATLGMVVEPQSPLMTGVKTLSFIAGSLAAGGAINGGTVVAKWSGGQSLLVRGVAKARNRADVNLYPVSANGAPQPGWTGDGATLLRDALRYH